VTDITQFAIGNGKLYLAAIKDLFHKEIVGWAIADHMRTELCLEALRNGLKRHRPDEGLIHHSDQGSQDCSAAYIKELEQNEIKPFSVPSNQKGYITGSTRT
jgi:Integrase core domain.